MRSGKIRGVVAGDTLLIDTGDGKFGRAVQKSFFGLPVKVGTDWYEVEVSGDGAKVSAVPTAIETGQIRIAHGSWSAMLVGKKHLVNLSGGSDPIDVPADEYAVMNYAERGTGGSAKAHVRCRNSNIRVGNAKTLEIAAGELTEVTIGSPLTAKLKVRQQAGRRLLGAKQRQVNFSLELTDAYGASVSSLTGANGQQPPEPRIEVFDAAGKKVHSGAMKYG